MHNVTLRRVRATILAVEKQETLQTLSVLPALGIQHAMRVRHVVICGLPRSTVFFNFIS
jgi:hypothetical protein